MDCDLWHSVDTPRLYYCRGEVWGLDPLAWLPLPILINKFRGVDFNPLSTLPDENSGILSDLPPIARTQMWHGHGLDVKINEIWQIQLWNTLAGHLRVEIVWLSPSLFISMSFRNSSFPSLIIKLRIRVVLCALLTFSYSSPCVVATQAWSSILTLSVTIDLWCPHSWNKTLKQKNAKTAWNVLAVLDMQFCIWTLVISLHVLALA